MEKKAKGSLIIIGGAEVKSDKSVILKEVVNAAGGEDSRIVILSTATENPSVVGNEYINVFKRIGVKNVEHLNIDTREEANNDENIKKIENSTCVFLQEEIN